MKRINVTLYDEIYEKLEIRMKNNGEKSIAHAIRELVDLALKVEEAAKKNDGPQEKNDLEKLIEMQESDLTWGVETRLLVRHLVENLPGSDKENQIKILEKYKENAIHYIKGMLENKVK